MKRILFITSNKHKFREAETILKPFGINICHEFVSYPEARAETCSEVAVSSAKWINALLDTPFFVEDSGLFVRALKGFPGAYSGWFHRKLGCEGLLRLLAGVKDRRAEFVSAIAYSDAEGIHSFQGKCPGVISLKEQGRSGFGFDPVFAPKGFRRTFAEDPALKQRVSHRAASIRKLALHLKKEA